MIRASNLQYSCEMSELSSIGYIPMALNAAVGQSHLQRNTSSYSIGYFSRLAVTCDNILKPLSQLPPIL